MTALLIVDDEADIADTLKAYLEYVGYQASVAYDGRDALAKVFEAPPDLIITDMMMPRMSGRELIHQLEANPLLQSIPIIVMSAQQQPDGYPFLRKPFHPDELVTEIRRVLDHRH